MPEFDALRNRIVAIEMGVGDNASDIVNNAANIAANADALLSLEQRLTAAELSLGNIDARLLALENAAGTPDPEPEPPTPEPEPEPPAPEPEPAPPVPEPEPESGFPSDVPSIFEPEYPAEPTGAVVEVSGSSDISVNSNTTYRLVGDFSGRFTISPGVSTVLIDGQGFTCGPVVFPAQWAANPETKCSDITVRNMRRVGGDSGFLVYGERILIENVECREEDFTAYGLYSWGARNLTVRDSHLHSQGGEAGSRYVRCNNVAMYRCDLGTPTKHSMRIHGTSGPCSYICWAHNTTSSPWYMGYQDRPGEFLIDHLYVANNTLNPNLSTNPSWFQTVEANLIPTQLQNFTFINNTGPGTGGSPGNLAYLEGIDDPTWVVTNNIA